MNKRLHPKRILRAGLLHGLMLILAGLWLLPIFWLLLCSFGVDEGPNIRSFFPQGYTLGHYLDLLGAQDSVSRFPRWFLNSLSIAVCSCLISSAFVLATAYCMSCLRFPLRRPMMRLALLLNLFPGFLAMIAVYSVLKRLGLTDSNTGLIIIYSATSALTYLVAKGFFDTVPRAIREAAMMEGASEAVIFLKIILPLSRPILVYTVISAFLAPWTDFIFANMMLPSKISAQKTVALGLYSLASPANINEYFARFCAGGVLISLPISVLFVIMQKFYVAGVTGGAVKG